MDYPTQYIKFKQKRLVRPSFQKNDTPSENTDTAARAFELLLYRYSHLGLRTQSLNIK
jgi:hypothetical protein